MVPLETVFIGLVIFFGLVGMLRGWAKELLVTFAVILGRFIELVIWQYVPVVNTSLQTLAKDAPRSWFYVRLGIFVLIVCFGYATTKISAALGAKARKDKLQDGLLGFFLGLLNGFLVVGMVWGFMAEPTLNFAVWNITPPVSDLAKSLAPYLPLGWLEGEALFVAVALAFACVLVVFV